MPAVNMKDLLEAGVHFGHQTHHWNPKMKPYVFGARNGIYIVDLQKTVDAAKKATDFLKKIVSDGKKVIFVGTKKQAKEIIQNEATRAGMFYVNDRWLGGLLTNFSTVKASIDRLKKLEALKASPEWKDVPKKEQSRIDRDLKKLLQSLGGIQDMKKIPGALFIIDTNKEHIAVKEAKRLGIPVVAIVDTNCNPDDITHVIPGNDDAIRSVSYFAKLMADSCIEGAKLLEEKLRAQGIEAEKVTEEETQEKKVSRFEGDVDLQGLDEADIEALEAMPEEEAAQITSSEIKN